MRQNLVVQFVQLLKHSLYDVWSHVVMEKSWVHSVDQCGLRVLQFSVHLIKLLSILLRCNGFAGIQKAVVVPIGSRPPNSDQDLFLVHLINLLSILLRCNGFIRIQKAVVDQASSRPP